jgi:hypothetical protein
MRQDGNIWGLTRQARNLQVVVLFAPDFEGVFLIESYFLSPSELRQKPLYD